MRVRRGLRAAPVAIKSSSLQAGRGRHVFRCTGTTTLPAAPASPLPPPFPTLPPPTRSAGRARVGCDRHSLKAMQRKWGVTLCSSLSARCRRKWADCKRGFWGLQYSEHIRQRNSPTEGSRGWERNWLHAALHKAQMCGRTPGISPLPPSSPTLSFLSGCGGRDIRNLGAP